VREGVMSLLGWMVLGPSDRGIKEYETMVVIRLAVDGVLLMIPVLPILF